LAKEFFRQKRVLKVIEDYGNDLIAPDEHVQG
jgi:hypothetical protein